MDIEHSRTKSFVLRMPLSLREEASSRATKDGVSLNHFICLAITEKTNKNDSARRRREAAIKAGWIAPTLQ